MKKKANMIWHHSWRNLKGGAKKQINFNIIEDQWDLCLTVKQCLDLAQVH